MGRIAEIQRRHLEQIMGSEAVGIVTAEVSLWDPKVCRSFVAGTCVHDLFANTKMDIGPCTRIHQAKLKNEWTSQMEQAEKNKDQQKIAQLNLFRVDHERTIFGYVDECDRKVRAAQRRLEKTPEENNRTTALMREIGEIEGAYQAAMAEVELLGSEGKVDESIAQLTKAEALKAEKSDKERELQNLSETSGASGHQKLRVCDICGAYLSVLDSDRRLADHFGGKMHIGYLQIRTMMDEWRARGPLKTAPPPAPEMLNRPKEVDLGPPPPTTFRPIPPEKRLTPLKPAPPPPPPAMSPPRGAPSGPSAERAPPKAVSAYGGSDRRDDRRDDRDRDARDSRSHRDGGDDRRSSSRRYDDDDHRRSDRDRTRDSDTHRSSRREDDHRADDRRGDDRRSSSRRYDDDEVVMRSSRSRRDEDDGRGSRRPRDEPGVGAGAGAGAGVEAKPEVRAVSSSSHNNHSRSAGRETRARSGEVGEDRGEEKHRRVD